MIIMIGALGFVMTASLFAQSSGPQAKATLMDAQGQTVGDATLTETPHGVLIHVNLTKAPGGVHAFHIHAVGKCEAPFTSAG
jgi:Cu-Zn family superoxide dismutase